MAEEIVMFSMRIPLDLKSRLDGVARLDRRSTASLLQVIARAWLAQDVYQPSFDPNEVGRQELELMRADLRSAPGRPRQRINPRINLEFVGPPILACFEGKERLTYSDIIEATKKINSPAPMVLVNEVLFRNGWREYRNSVDERVWIKLSD